jgi:hypothetical protein
MSSELACDGQPTQHASGISALATANQWIDVQAAGPKGREGLRTRQYSQSAAPAPPSIAQALRAMPAPAPVAFAATTVQDVVEANEAVSPKAVEAWLVETEPRLALNRKALVQMTGAGVNEHVIDLLVALAYPERFEVHRSGSAGAAITGSTGGVFSNWSLSSAGGPWSFGYDPYSYYYSPFAPWYLEGMYSYYLTGGGTYVTLPNETNGTGPATHGQVVNGQGYTRVEPRETAHPVGGGAGGGSASTASAPFSSGDSGVGSSASPSGYSSGGGGGSSGGGGGGTAVPR